MKASTPRIAEAKYAGDYRIWLRFADGVTAGWLPLVAMVGLMGLELLVAALQAYVFALLTCLYLSDAMHVDH